MRIFFLVAFTMLFHGNGIAQQFQTREDVIKWLQANLPQYNNNSRKSNGRVNFTKMCVNVNLLPAAQAGAELENPENFQDKIVSDVSWTQNEIYISNSIFIHGTLRAAYTYHVPLTAITKATLTNCQRNAEENVNAYVDRPVFIHTKKNTVKINHQVFDKNGKAGNTRQYGMNTKDADWDSIIPIAGNWDKNTALQNQVVAALTRLAELNDKKYTVN